ncbi:MAG: hypothetical protein ACYTEL_08545 [Planctomycetota bacterium]|jgi:hypothetical protein
MAVRDPAMLVWELPDEILWHLWWSMYLWVMIAVNERGEGNSFAVKGLPAEMEGKRLYRFSSQESHVVRNGGFRDGIRGFGVHVYATTRKLEVK